MSRRGAPRRVSSRDMPAPTDLLSRVPLFAELSDRELKKLARSFKESKFSSGDVIAAQGKGGVGFFVIGEGEVAYSVDGQETGRGGPGEYFGEIALIDDGPRSASVTAVTDVLAYGLTSWEFRPLVEEDATIAWELLQTMAKRLRAAQRSS
jgi:CRP/FNR family cyclic AMP-dependent transcriptional regulator